MPQFANARSQLGKGFRKSNFFSVPSVSNVFDHFVNWTRIARTTRRLTTQDREFVTIECAVMSSNRANHSAVTV